MMIISQDPKRTGKAKIRKLVAKKKADAYKKRKELQNIKELTRFTEKDKLEKNSCTQKFHKCYHEMSKPTTKDVKNQFLHGLKGGSSTFKRRMESNTKSKELKLMNRGSDCFVNSVIQLLMSTEYMTFIECNLPHLLHQSAPDTYPFSRLLRNIYRKESLGKNISVAAVRTFVAHVSGKHYLDNGTQQDAEEFFRAMELILSEELLELESFRKCRDNHWGRKEIRRIFRNSTRDGKCENCGQIPSSISEPFFLLQLNVVHSISSINLSTLIENHFTESTTTERIKCSNCCPHDRDRLPCSLTEMCKVKEASEITQLLIAPKYLLIQLLRYDGKGNKIRTLVNINDELLLQNNLLYSPVGILNHIGPSPNHGHYVTFRKKNCGQWIFYDDALNQPSSLKVANSSDNYLLVFCRKDVRAGCTPK